MSSVKRKRRTREKIVFEILRECKEPALKTQIMERINLSFAVLNKYLDFLKERELIAKEEERYKTTEKGQKFVKAFERLQNLLK